MLPPDRARSRATARSPRIAVAPAPDASIRVRAFLHPPPQLIGDRLLRVRRPVEENDHDSSRSRKLLAIVFANFVNEIQRRVAHLADAHAHLDRLEADLLSEVARRARDDEAE